MFGLLSLVFLTTMIYQGVKDVMTPTIPAENWENKDLYYQDIMNGVSPKQRMINLKNGKYKLTEKYPKPHRNERGQIIIENCQLWKDDLNKYGAYQVNKWVEQGKYNLSPEKLKKEEERIEKHLEHLYSLS